MLGSYTTSYIVMVEPFHMELAEGIIYHAQSKGVRQK